MCRSLQSKILEYELLVDLIDSSDIVKWADDEILKSESPSSDLCDLSLTNEKEKQIKILSIMSRGNENEAFERICLKLAELYSNGSLNFFEVVNKLLPIYWHARNLKEEYANFCNWVDDEACLVAEGVKDLESAQIELSKFFSQFHEKQA